MDSSAARRGRVGGSDSQAHAVHVMDERQCDVPKLLFLAAALDHCTMGHGKLVLELLQAMSTASKLTSWLKPSSGAQ
jgi:hypothetical protein